MDRLFTLLNFFMLMKMILNQKFILYKLFKHNLFRFENDSFVRGREINFLTIFLISSEIFFYKRILVKLFQIKCIQFYAFLISRPLTNEYSFNLYKFIAYTHKKNIYQSHEFYSFWHINHLYKKQKSIKKLKIRQMAKIN